MRAVALGLLCAGLLVSAARAEEDPSALPQDSRMRIIAYSPSQVFHLSTATGATMVVAGSGKILVCQTARQSVRCGLGHPSITANFGRLHLSVRRFSPRAVPLEGSPNP